MLTIAISGFAVLVSLGSLILAHASSRRAQMPVLQFMWEDGREDEEGGGDGSGGGGWPRGSGCAAGWAAGPTPCCRTCRGITSPRCEGGP
ncbi:hypothetical protein GCM10009801_42010 [Streptomyces albiaxialis]|uniref:Uncharacterized protein n=1 Tax=Streptomyces albiaxialis TaxID=329523 RepID=A0ABN2W6H7_9ACTN